MEQREFRMPHTGESWRHYKGGLYKIIGMAIDESGNAIVVYTEAVWSLSQLPPIFVQPIGRFLQEVENDKPRFSFSESATLLNCRFINPGQ